MKPKKSILEKFAEAKANLRRLEDELQAKIDEGLYAVVLREGINSEIPVRSLVKITEYDDDFKNYLSAETIDGNRHDYFNAEDLEIIANREQARAAFLSVVERQIDELFGAADE